MKNIVIFDSDGKCLSIGKDRVLETGESKFTIGVDLDWIVDIDRSGSIMTINPCDMLSTDIIIKKYWLNDIVLDGGIVRKKNSNEEVIAAISKIQSTTLFSVDLNKIMEAVTWEKIGLEYSQKISKINGTTIENYFQYVENVAKFQENGFDPSDYTLDPSDVTKTLVTPAIFGIVPDPPLIYANIAKHSI